MKKWIGIPSVLVALVACPEPEPEPRDLPASPASEAPTPCLDNPVPLLVRGTGAAERYYVEVEFDGAPAAMQFDTGSGLTFLFTGFGAPDYTPDVGALTIGNETLPVAGRGFDPPDQPIEGLEVIGLLGMDFMLGRPSRLTVADRELTRLCALPENSGVEIPFDSVLDHALVPVVIDGVAKRLMFDTGGGNTLLVGEEGRPGDVEVVVQDFEGNLFSIFEGTGVLEVGELARTIPVARVPEFPYFDQTVDALGGNLHGLLGVTAFPGETLHVDGETSRMWVQ